MEERQRQLVAEQLDRLCVNARGGAQLQRGHLQEDLIENHQRDQGLLMQIMPANRELLFRRDAFSGPMGHGFTGENLLQERKFVFPDDVFSSHKTRR